MIVRFFCFVGFNGQKRGRGRKIGYEADCTKRALVLFRCPEIRYSKKSAYRFAAADVTGTKSPSMAPLYLKQTSCLFVTVIEQISKNI